MTRRIIGSAVLFVLILGVYLIVSANAIQRPPSESWEYRFLNGIGCRPPCWEGVTPGITNQEELTRTLAAMGRIKLGTTKFTGSSSLLGTGGFDLVEASNASRVIGSVGFEQPLDGRVLAILLKTRYTMELSEVIALLGEPTDVVINVFPPYSGKAQATYELGLFFGQASVFVEPRSSVTEKLDLNPKLDIGAISFLNAGWDHDTALRSMRGQKTSVTPWRGYMPLADYCRALGPQSWCP